MPGGVVRARLYATARGLYEARLNGHRVGDQVLAPGWTSYTQRLRYQTYDVTDLVREGGNELEVLLGNGWYPGRLSWGGRRALYGDRLALLAQLEVTTADGTVHRLGTDASWTARESGVLADDLYDGQRTDLRPGPADHTDAVEVVDADLARLVAPDGPPVRVTQTLPATAVFSSPSGATLVDFGQNLIGWVRLRVRDQAPGHEVVVRHAEVLEHGELGVRPLRTAKATDSYLLAGGPGGARAEPHLPRLPLRRDQRPARGAGRGCRGGGRGLRPAADGMVQLLDPQLDRFHENVVWGMRGNFVDVPTDCPQRDERLGWTGDIQVFAPTASFLFDSAGFLSSWLADLAAEQRPDGSVPLVVPDVIESPGPAAAAWGDAASARAMGPLPAHRRRRAAGPAAAEHAGLGRLHRRPRRGRPPVDRGFQLGDWLDPTAPQDAPFEAQADPDVVATAYLARSAEVVGLAAAVAGDADVAGKYAPPGRRGAGRLRARVRDRRRAGAQRRPDGVCPGARLGPAAHRRPAPPCRGPPGRPGAVVRLPGSAPGLSAPR